MRAALWSCRSLPPRSSRAPVTHLQDPRFEENSASGRYQGLKIGAIAGFTDVLRASVEKKSWRG
jgi:hypothetical protein